MEDVVLHYRPEPAGGLARLCEQTEKLLAPFTCRPPPVFKPWFPEDAADRRLPIRPAAPPPIITAACTPGSSTRAAPDGTPECLRAPKDDAPPSPRSNKAATLQDGAPAAAPAAAPVKRSWSIFAQRGLAAQCSHWPSARFRRAVTLHGLHLRQRAKWVIGQHNCGAAGGIEQVWRALSRSAHGAGLPTCNANLQRERAEIWVYCDVLHCEQVGRFLKELLQLSGRIRLAVRNLGDVFSM